MACFDESTRQQDWPRVANDFAACSNRMEACFRRSCGPTQDTHSVANMASDPLEVPEIRVLLIEDIPDFARLVEITLRRVKTPMDVRLGTFITTAAYDLATAVDFLQGRSFDVILLDLNLPDSRGLGTLEQVQLAAGDTPIVVLTSADDDSQALAAIQQGAQDYIIKNHLEGRLLRRTLRHAIERHRATVQLQQRAREVEAARFAIEQQSLELKARAEQLDRINRELDDFTYIASHDLKAPLHGIAAYCDIMLEDYHDRLDREGRRRLETMVRLCGRLETLIGDLLTYCRVGGMRPAETGIDLEEVAREALDTLRPNIDQHGGCVQVVGRLPKVTGDPMLIGMVLSNLVSNGLKFNDHANAQVVIGALPTAPPTIYVQDNGIGIDPKHHDEIFAIFRRLHGQKQYEGSGAGLTIVRKIVEAHGGRVWLDSTPGQGTTFYLTLAPTADEPIERRATQQPPPRAPHWTAGSSHVSTDPKTRGEEISPSIDQSARSSLA